MAGEAAVGKKWTDIAIEFELCSRLIRRKANRCKRSD
jgi:hypothetical protein